MCKSRLKPHYLKYGTLLNPDTVTELVGISKKCSLVKSYIEFGMNRVTITGESIDRIKYLVKYIQTGVVDINNEDSSMH